MVFQMPPIYNLESNLDNLRSKLSEGLGKQILVVSQQERINGCPGIISPPFIDPMFLGIDTTLKLGVLTSVQIKKSDENSQESLDLDPNFFHPPKIALSTLRYAVRGYGYRDNWDLVEQDMEIFLYDLSNLGEEIERRDTPMSNDINSPDRYRSGLRVHVGKEVANYFRGANSANTSYVEALKLLDLDHEIPDDFRKARNEEIRRSVEYGSPQLF